MYIEKNYVLHQSDISVVIFCCGGFLKNAYLTWELKEEHSDYADNNLFCCVVRTLELLFASLYSFSHQRYDETDSFIWSFNLYSNSFCSY